MATKAISGLYAGISESDQVNDFIWQLIHPMKPVAEYLRTFILKADKSIGEGIYWNAPTFYYTGKMQPFNQKEHKRYIVGFNFYKQDTLRLVFLFGADADDPNHLLSGEFKDKRKLITFRSIEEVKRCEPEFKKVIKSLIRKMK